ncbi:MAG: hypothetical protein NTW99_10490 [Chloroflexi bacterium]|nr:hypothetical protein [Chloroflexota bacterium]
MKYIHPLMADFGILGGVLFAVSAYGFFTKKNWAFFLSVVALVLALLGSWFINVPYMAAGLPPVYFTLFWPYVLLYFLFLKAVGKTSWSQTLLALLTGVAYIFCWMNGVSSTSRIITIGDPIFVLVERLHWVAMIGCSRGTPALGGDDRVGRCDCRHHHQAERMDADRWPRFRCDGTCGGHPTRSCHSAATGALLPVRSGANFLPDPDRAARLAESLAAAHWSSRLEKRL